MDFKIIATNNYATASKAVIQLLKKTNQTDLTTNHIVISNDRCRMTSELEMLDALGGSFNTHVLTFARLTTRLMKEKPFISKQSAIMLISRLADELSDKFLCFTKSFGTAGFAANIYETISQLKYSAILPEQIEPSQFEKNLQLKMHDIKLIYQAYEDFIKERYIDSGAKLNHLIKAIPDSDFVKNSYFYIKDFDDFSTQEEMIIRQLIIYSKGVVVAIPFVKNRRIYPSENFENLCLIAKGLRIEPDVTFLSDNQPNYVSHLEQNLFDYKTDFVKKPAHEVYVSKESDVFAEAETIAKHIRHQTRMGARYKDFLVVAGNVNKYAYALERAFAKYEIAYFLDNKISLGSHALAQYVTGILKAFKNNFRREDCLAVMKNYFYKTNNDIFRFENICLKNNFRFFAKPFEGDSEDIVFAEQTRSEFVSFADSFGFLHKDDATAYTGKLKAFLQSDDMANMVEQLCKQADGIDDGLEKTSQQATDKILCVLDTLQALFGDLVLSDQKFADLLQTGLDAETISIIPLYNDCVVVASVAKSRANANKHLIILGANDGEFPVSHGDTRIVSDGDIDNLSKMGVNLSPKMEKENFKEKFNVYQLLTAPRQSLFVTYLANADKSTPCLAVEEILKMFDVNNEYVELLKNSEQVYCKSQATEKLVAEMSKIADGNTNGLQQTSNLYYALDQKDVNDFVFKTLQKPNLDKGKNVLLPRGETAVTKIECFYACPYKYFLQNGLKLKPRDMGEIKSFDTGTIIHDVLENFVKTVFVDKKAGDDFSVETMAIQLLQQVLKRDEYQYLSNHPKLEHLVERVSKECVFACNEVYSQIENSSFKPYATELAFGFDGSDVPPVKIVADGHEIMLVGKIDRVDVYEDKFVLVDYKTGKASFNETELYIGKKLQLLTYVQACLQAMQKECAGFFYLPVNNDFGEENKRFSYIGRVKGEKEVISLLDNNAQPGQMSSLFGKTLTKEGLLKGKTCMTDQQLQVCLDYTQKMLQNAIKDMADGYIAQHPYKSNCDFCDYAEVCNFQDLGGREDSVTDIDCQVLAEVTYEV